MPIIRKELTPAMFKTPRTLGPDDSFVGPVGFAFEQWSIWEDSGRRRIGRIFRVSHPKAAYVAKVEFPPRVFGLGPFYWAPAGEFPVTDAGFGAAVDSILRILATKRPEDFRCNHIKPWKIARICRWLRDCKSIGFSSRRSGST